MATMDTTHTPQGEQLTRESFLSSFPNVKHLIRKEWPQIEEAVLDATNGDLDKVVDLVARKVEIPRGQVRQQLQSFVGSEQISGVEARLNRIVAALEDRSKQVMDMVRDDIVPQAEENLRNNLWKSLLGAMGLGLVVGLWFGMSRARHH